jgi:hypothetical protein
LPGKHTFSPLPSSLPFELANFGLSTFTLDEAAVLGQAETGGAPGLASTESQPADSLKDRPDLDIR